METCGVVVSIIISGSPTLLHSSPCNGGGEKGRCCEKEKLTNPALTSFTLTSRRIQSASWGEREPMMSNELLRYFGEEGFGGGYRLGGRQCVVLGWVVRCERRGGVHSSIIWMLGT